LRWFSESGPAGRVFVGPRGGLLRRSNFRGRWVAALRTSSVPHVHFHDLRHTGNTLAADTGASTRELMHRMGHSTMDAALRYQHMRGERDRLIADSIDEAIKKATGKKPKRKPRRKKPPDPSGTGGARD
jgi:integrase